MINLLNVKNKSQDNNNEDITIKEVQIPQHLSGIEQKSIAVTSSSGSFNVFKNTELVPDKINEEVSSTRNPEKNENKTKPVPFIVRLSSTFRYINKDTNSVTCFVTREPKKYLFCRWSQIFLMLLVFAYYSHSTSQIILSYDPPQHVPLYGRCGETYLQVVGSNMSSSQLRNNCSVNKTLVNKCCPSKKGFASQKNLTCILDNLATKFTPFDSRVFTKLKQGQMLKDLRLKRGNQIEVIPAQFNKSSRYRVLEDETYLMEDGVLLLQNMIYLKPTDFCTEFITDINKTVVIKYDKGPFRYFVGGVKDTMVWFCLAPISTVALLLMLGLYFSQPELRNLHGKMLISHLLCQIAFFVTSSVHKLPAQHSLMSYLLNYTLQFSILGKHCWMTAMCLDVWISFSRPLRRPGKPKPHKFLLYSACCWGCACLLCVATAAVGVVPHVTDSCPKPRFEDDACFFSRRRTADLFINTPMALALLLNLVMFVSTVVNLRCLHVAVTVTVAEDRFQHQAATEGLSLYLKLALLMGINWLLVWVGFQVETMQVYLYVRAVISIQGLVEAVVLVCNKRMWNIIRNILFG